MCVGAVTEAREGANGTSVIQGLLTLPRGNRTGCWVGGGLQPPLQASQLCKKAQFCFQSIFPVFV